MANRKRNERPGQPAATNRGRRPSIGGGVAATSPEARRRDLGSGSATVNVRNQGAPRTTEPGYKGVVSRQGTGHYGRGQREQVGQTPQEPIAVLPNPVDRNNIVTRIMERVGLAGLANNALGVMPQAYWEDPMWGGEYHDLPPAGWAHMTYNPAMAVDYSDPASIAAARMPRFHNGQQVFGYGDDPIGLYTYTDDPRTSIENYLALGLEDYMQGLHGYGRGPLNRGFGDYSTGR